MTLYATIIKREAGKTSDGKILKCSTSYIRDDDGSLHYVFGINYDISKLTIVENALHSLITPVNTEEKPREITHNVNDLLDHLIEESVALVGKPVTIPALSLSPNPATR